MTKLSSRELTGAILVDKDSHSSSYDVIRILKRRFGFEKIGHSGTLDPLATGLLVVLVGEATRVQDITMSSRKCYEGRIQLGVRTSTDDREGEVLFEDSIRDYRRRDPEELLSGLRTHFSGTIFQKPPAFSAIKQSGKRSYELAREGVHLELPEREVEIFSLELSFLEEDILFYRVECSKGFYVRSLARDIGVYLGSAATIDSLRRLSSGPFEVSQAIPQKELATRDLGALNLVSLSDLVKELPSVLVSFEELEALYQGKQNCLGRHTASAGQTYALRTQDGQYRGLLQGMEVGSEGGEPQLRIRYLLGRTGESAG